MKELIAYFWNLSTGDLLIWGLGVLAVFIVFMLIGIWWVRKG